MEFSFLTGNISRLSEIELPGEASHQLMSPQHRLPAADYLNKVESYRTGCVMALLLPDDDHATQLLLIERTESQGVHSGQISFPGGKLEEADIDFADAALRETQEEIGINRENITLIRQLTRLYIPPSNFLVYPFLGYVNTKPLFRPSADEVRNILLPHVSFFTDESNRRTDKFQSSRGYVVEAPYYSYNQYKIWGATAMIISEVTRLLQRL